LANAYLDALIHHDPTSLPLSDDVRFTENGQRLELGQALWKTVSGATGYRIHVADPAHGQVCMLSMVLENDMPAFLSIRLKIGSSAKICEIETLVGRTGHGVVDRPQRLSQADPIFSTPLKPSERLAREDMVAIADSYFEGLVNPGTHPPFDPACNRFENGIQTTNREEAGATWASWNCEQQYHAGFSKMVEANKDRRCAAVDEELGLVYALIIMQITGEVRSITISDGSIFVPPDRYLQPRSLLAHELFKIVDGRIRRLESIYVVVPYGSNSGW
jgi:hypothetical protein